MFLSSARLWQVRLVTAGLSLTASFFVGHNASGGDWPQLLGPQRNGIAAVDERLADRWPDAGPPVVWQRPVGSGYAGVAVATGRVLWR